MATPVIMPRQGQSVESCILAKWYKKAGDTVAVGDPLFSYETDKAGFEEEAKEAGTLLAVFFEEGDDVECLLNVCVIGNPGESFEEYRPGGDTQEKPAESAEIAPAPVIASAVQTASAEKGSEFISPRAKNAADRLGVDPRAVAPTGPEGRIIERDIIAARQNGTGLVTPAAKAAGIETGEGNGLGGRVTTAGAVKTVAAGADTAEKAPVAESVGYTDEAIPHIRKVIAKAMHSSLSEMAQLTYNSVFDATCIIKFRERIKNGMEFLGLENITLNDIVLYAVSRVLMKPEHRDLNANFLNGTTMRYFENVNLGVAVETPRGLLVPTIFNANLKSLNEIAAESKSLAKLAKSGSINPDLLKGGSFTVSNLGNLGIESFTPVINPPQTAILGVDTMMWRVRPGADGQPEMYRAMGLSLTCDHMVIDGSPSARFLQDLGKSLESFDVLLAK